MSGRLRFALALLTLVAAAGAGAREGWYAVLSAGTAAIEVARNLSPGEGFLDIDDREVSLAGDVGYAPLPWLAFEVGYQALGEVGGSGFYCPPGQVCALVVSGASGRTDAWTASVVPTLALSSAVALYAELGASRWRLRPRLEPPNPRRLGSITETDFRLGIGGRATITRQLDVQLEAALFDDHWTAMAGLRWWLRPASPSGSATAAGDR